MLDTPTSWRDLSLECRERANSRIMYTMFVHIKILPDTTEPVGPRVRPYRLSRVATARHDVDAYDVNQIDEDLPTNPE